MEDLPPGYRFYPTEEELVHFYLRNKLDGMRADLNHLIDRIIPTLDIYEFNPWDLPEFSGEACRGDPEQWFFFVPRKENEVRGGRPNRLTTFGYWKATGSPGYVYSSSNRIVGFKRTMVFYNGRAPNGVKTEWKMNEYMVLEGGCDPDSSIISHQLRQEYSLCRLYKKSKTLRAFDRRPIADRGGSNCRSGQVFAGHLNCEDTTAIPSDLDHRHRYHQTTTSTHTVNPPQEVQRPAPIDSSSPESSSSFGEISHGDRVADYEAMLPIEGIDPLWEWINVESVLDG